MKGRLAALPLTVPAGGVLPVGVTGQFVHLAKSDDLLWLRLDDEPEVPFNQGFSFALPEPLRFRRLYLRNPGQQAISLELVTGEGRLSVLRARPHQVACRLVPAQSVTWVHPVNSLEPSEGLSDSWSPFRPAGRWSNMAWRLQNLSSTDALDVMIGGWSVFSIGPLRTIYLELGHVMNFSIQNNSGSVIPFCLSYIWSLYQPPAA